MAPLSLARRLGADATVTMAESPAQLNGEVQHRGGFEVAFEVSGSPAGVASCLESVRPGGSTSGWTWRGVSGCDTGSHHSPVRPSGNLPTGSPSAPSVKAADAYHHGDLRAALIVAAREALGTMPPEAITLKSLAARLGVSQPAPYRHFQSREALLAAVAADGFDRFRTQLAQTEANASDGEKFEACWLACLALAAPIWAFVG
jgi:hypothetical protein